MVANDENIVAFLGDAENPAHTAWNSNAEKLTDRWRNAGATLSSIRHSLRHFHDLLSERQDTKDDDALRDFFSLVDQGQDKKRKKRRVPKPEIDVPKRETAIVIQKRKGGFQIVLGPAVADWALPQDLRVRVAYDMIGANPFKRHSRFDFDLTNGDITLESDGAKVVPANQYSLAIRITDKDFRISASGFDERRDIVVDARVSR